MTTTPTYPWSDQLGQFVVWTVCVGPNDDTDCTNYYPHEHTGTLTADWGTAVAGFGRSDAEKCFGKRVTPRLIERFQDPDWIDDENYNPSDPSTWPTIGERIVPTWTESIVVDTDQRDQIHPKIELFDGAAGEVSVAGIIDGTYYVYPVVFQDAQFCYLPRCSGVGADFAGEHCLGGTGNFFPLEPYLPDCNPPVYPMDSITRFIPSSNTQEDILYNATWSYYIREDAPTDPNEVPDTSTINMNMVVYAPSEDWQALMTAMMELTYFYNGIYH